MTCWEPPLPKIEISKVSQAIVDARGTAVKAARMLGIAETTIYRFLKKYPELKETLNKARAAKFQTNLDIAEDVLYTVLESVDEDKKTALDAAKFLLNTGGKPRGYNNQVDVAVNSTLSDKEDWAAQLNAKVDAKKNNEGTIERSSVEQVEGP